MDTEKKNSRKSQDSGKVQSKQGPESFNPEELQKEFQDLIQKKFGSKVQILSMTDGFSFQEEKDQDDEKQEETVAETLESVGDFNFKPKEVKAYLDRFVIGQDDAKKALSIAVCDHYNHIREDGKSSEDINYQKQNMLILGPTGVGKTYLIRLISDLIGVPFVKADSTRFSEVGYMGANVDDIIRDLVQKAGGNKELASKGIVYVDEVDKLASRRDYLGRDVSGRGVQFGFLRLLENTDVDINANHDITSQFKTFMNFQKKGKAEKEVVNTKNILFIFSGAFHGLEDIINDRLSKKSIGFHTDKTKQDVNEVFKKLEAGDLVEFGFEHEFVGRVPIRVSCENLSEKDLYEILIGSEHSIVYQYIESFRHYGIKLKFKKKALRLLAKKAFEQKTGARALYAVFEEVLRPFKFELPSTSIKNLEVDEALVSNPQGVLHHLTTDTGAN